MTINLFGILQYYPLLKVKMKKYKHRMQLIMLGLETAECGLSYHARNL